MKTLMIFVRGVPLQGLLSPRSVLFLLLMGSLVTLTVTMPQTQVVAELIDDHIVQRLVKVGALSSRSSQGDELNFLPQNENRDAAIDVDASMYSFEKVRLGFIGNYSYQLSFMPKFELEQKILEAFPSYLRQKVAPLVRPTLVICEKYQVDPFWAFSIMWTESHFVPTAESRVGAKGLMQIMPRTKSYLLSLAKEESIIFEFQKGEDYLKYIFPLYAEARGKKTKAKLRAKVLNIELGVFYLKKLLLYFDSNYLHATVAYNMGPGWTKGRLRRNGPVGVDNNYLDKVRKAYRYITTQFNSFFSEPNV